jgi:hypothetical protein
MREHLNDLTADEMRKLLATYGRDLRALRDALSD